MSLNISTVYCGRLIEFHTMFYKIRCAFYRVPTMISALTKGHSKRKAAPDGTRPYGPRMPLHTWFRCKMHEIWADEVCGFQTPSAHCACAPRRNEEWIAVTGCLGKALRRGGVDLRRTGRLLAVKDSTVEDLGFDDVRQWGLLGMRFLHPQVRNHSPL